MPLSLADAAHLCRRVGFAGTRAELNHFVGRSVADVVDEVVETIPNLPSRPGLLDDDNLAEWEKNVELVEWWLRRMVNARWTNRSAFTPSPFAEKMALFWHGHFACGFGKVGYAWPFFDQTQIFRRHGLGNFARLTKDISISSAMLMYLDNETNTRGSPQENFARELMELHTIGVGNFTEHDVIAMAEAWTGHNVYGWNNDEHFYDVRYRFFPNRHDGTSKRLFGINRNWDGPDTIDELVRGARRDACAQFITTKLWRYFVSSSPPSYAINGLAAKFKSTNMNVRELMRAMLRHGQFWDPANRYGLVRSPVELTVDGHKRTGVPLTSGSSNWIMRQMGQEIFEPPNVAGWGTHGYWLSTATAWGRASWAQHMRWRAYDSEFLEDLRDRGPTQVVNTLFETFGIYQPSPATRARFQQWASYARQNHPWNIPTQGILMTLLSPDFQVA